MALGPWQASVATGDGGASFDIDTTHVKHGAKSLHVHCNVGSTAHGTLSQHTTDGGALLPGNDFYGRAWVYYSNAGGAGLPLGVHSWLFNSTGPYGGGTVTMNMGGGGNRLQLNYHPVAPLTEQSKQGGSITSGAWHCLQWEYDGAGNAATVWVDGTAAVEVDAGTGWNMGKPWRTIDLGFTHYQALTNPVDVYLDDFALGTTKLACPP
jgi:hypothetical protein